MTGRYTAEDFDKCRDSFTAWDDGADRIILAALSIASAVMRPGVIEEALDSFDDLVSPEAIAEIIRAALTGSHDGN